MQDGGLAAIVKNLNGDIFGLSSLIGV